MLLLQMLLLLQEAPAMLLLLLLPQLLCAARAVPLQIYQLGRRGPRMISSSNACSAASRHTLALQWGPVSITQRCALLQLLQV